MLDDVYTAESIQLEMSKDPGLGLTESQLPDIKKIRGAIARHKQDPNSLGAIQDAALCYSLEKLNFRDDERKDDKAKPFCLFQRSFTELPMFHPGDLVGRANHISDFHVGITSWYLLDNLNRATGKFNTDLTTTQEKEMILQSKLCCTPIIPSNSTTWDTTNTS
jgi:hypothetical protein